jgi:hypothetical protein
MRLVRLGSTGDLAATRGVVLSRVRRTYLQKCGYLNSQMITLIPNEHVASEGLVVTEEIIDNG